MNLKLLLYISIVIVFETQYVRSLPLNSTSKLQSSEFDEYGDLISEDGDLIPEQGEAYFLNDHGKPVLGLFDGVNPMRSDKSDRKNIHFHLYTRDNPTESYQLFVDDIPLLKASPFNRKYETKILIHGFTNSLQSDFIQTLKDAYLANKKVKFNVIAVDWGSLCGAPWYYSASTNTMRVGKYVAKFVDVLVKEMKLNLADLHIVGHSLGAHTAGIVGKHITTPGKISRMTGLDPALPLYALARKKWRLTTDDADFVDVIHTSGGDLGFLDPIGHIDFYPNGGVSSQPGCGWDLTASCSHSRSWEYYGETVRNKNAFPTKPCENLKQAQTGACDSYRGDAPNMGEHAYYDDEFENGLFYTKTNKKPPYAINQYNLFFGKLDKRHQNEITERTSRQN